MTNEELLDKIQQHRANARDEEEKAKKLTGLLEAKLEAEGVPNLATETASAFWQAQTKVEVKDWNAVMEFVYINKAFDILQRRVSPAQLKARIDAGAKIKGVTIVEGARTFIVKGKKDAD